jgi:aminopeptidase
MTHEELARYADAIVGVALAVRKGDEVIVNADLPYRTLAAPCVEAAYRAGARHAEVLFADADVQAAQIRNAPDELLGWQTPWRAAYMRWRQRPEVAAVLLLDDGDPVALAGLDPERLALHATGMSRFLPWTRAPRNERRRRWVFAVWPDERWAQQVYSGVKPATAQRRLARDLLDFCRIGPDDPPNALRKHLDALHARARRLTRLALDRVEYRGPGTELTVRLPAEALWAGPWWTNDHGKRFASNLPTEEVFTSPHAAGTEGVFRCSRPILLHGRLVDGLEGEFRGGRLVRLREKGGDGDFVRRYLAGIRNADRLGEIALVDSSSRIGRTGRTYLNLLIDENAVAHMAFGSAFDETRPTGRGGGLNRSHTHVDVMLGSDDLEVTGVRRNGRKVPLLRDGAWQI